MNIIKKILVFLFCGIACIAGITSQNKNAFFSDISGSYSKEILSSSGIIGNNAFLVSTSEYENYTFFKTHGVVKAYRLSVDNLTAGITSILYYCQKIENGYFQLLVNYDNNGCFVDALIIAEDKVDFVNELSDGSYMYSTEKFTRVSNGIIKITLRVEKGGTPWDNIPIEEEDTTTNYFIGKDGRFILDQP